MKYYASDNYYNILSIYNPTTGGVVDADTTPTVTAYKDGVLDNSFTLTVTKMSTGTYSVTGQIPSGTEGKKYIILATATVSTVSATKQIDSFAVEYGNTFNETQLIHSHVQTISDNVSTLDGKVETVDTVVNSIKTETDKIQTIDNNVDTTLTNVNTINGNVNTITTNISTLDGKVVSVDTVVDSIKVVTDVLNIMISNGKFTADSLSLVPTGGSTTVDLSPITVVTDKLNTMIELVDTVNKFKQSAIQIPTEEINIYSYKDTVYNEKENPVQGALVCISENASKLNPIKAGYTDTKGEIEFTFDIPGTYYKWTVFNGYLETPLTEIEIK